LKRNVHDTVGMMKDIEIGQIEGTRRTNNISHGVSPQEGSGEMI